MKTHSVSTSENKSQAIANSLPQLLKNNETSQFIDDRPEAIAQRKVQETINNSPRVQQLRAYQEMANNSLLAKNGKVEQAIADNNTSTAIQRNEKSGDKKVQGKFKPVQKKENNTGLPDELKSGIENISGFSMNDVKVHYNSDRPAQLQAHAFAQGTDIHLAPGQEKHLPHEAWHVIQQKQGRVQPTMQLKENINVNDDVGLEKEADEMGAKALGSSAKDIGVKVSQFKGSTVVDIYARGNKNGTIQKQAVVQRIIVVADSQLDYNQFVGVYQMLINGIDNRVTLLSLLSKSKIEGEQIGLRGHGYGPKGKYANMEAGVLAQLLKKAGVNESNQVIDLLSCSSGKGGDTSYAEDFAKAMGHSTTVYANKGVGVLMNDGYSYSKRDRTPDETIEYKKIFSDCAEEVSKAEQIADKGRSELLNPNLTESDVKEIFLRYGAEVLKVAGTLYRKLYEHQTKLLVDNDDPDQGVYVSPKK